jgi:hypothetical protein
MSITGLFFKEGRRKSGNEGIEDSMVETRGDYNQLYYE